MAYPLIDEICETRRGMSGFVAILKDSWPHIYEAYSYGLEDGSENVRDVLDRLYLERPEVFTMAYPYWKRWMEYSYRG